MRRGFTYAGGIRRQSRWEIRDIVCDRCDNTVHLEYETDAAMPSEERVDLYRALRHHGWVARIAKPRVEALCPTCGLEDGHGLG